MSDDNSNNRLEDDASPQLSSEQTAKRVPLILRAWWLSEHVQSADLLLPANVLATAAMWQPFSEPLFDAAVDYPDYE